MTIHIGNMHYSKPTGIVIYCGRPSALENTYIIGKHGDRNAVCDSYDRDFPEKVKTPGPFRDAIIEIYHLARTNDVTLMCYCTPRRCHCDTIKAFIDQFL